MSKCTPIPNFVDAQMDDALSRPANHVMTCDCVIDIGGSRLPETLRSMLMARMLDPAKPCVLPSALLSDDSGSSLWREINRLPAYYQTREEMMLLERHGDEIADLVKPGTTLIDLGCG